MEQINSSELPSGKKSKKYFLLNENIDRMPFKIMPLQILTPNGQKLVEDFKETNGEFLGGGVMKSKDFEAAAQKNALAMETYKRIQFQTSFMSKREVVKLSTQVTSEWIAFEYSLVFSITMYGLIIPVPWDQVNFIKIKKKGFLGQAVAEIEYKNQKKEVCLRQIQSSILNLKSLGEIAKACGVLVDL